MEKKTIKVKFACFWPEFNVENNFIINTLRKTYDVVFSEEPDFVFYSVFGADFKAYKNSVRIFYTEENITPNFNDCDYAIGFDNIVFDDRYLRLPLNSQYLKPAIQNRAELSDDLVNRKFCNFIYSNPSSGEGAPLRIDFCKKLMKYKHVDCPGKILNNMKDQIVARYDDDWEQGKIDFIRNYKFTVAFENSSSISYTTEKLIQPFMANSIPIYWGNPEVTREYNPKAFINCNDYENLGAVIEKIKELDSNDDLYLEMLRQPPMQPNYRFDKQEQLEKFLFNIMEKGNNPFNKNPRNWDYNSKLMRKIVDYKKIRFKYHRYQILSVFGINKKTRTYYKNRLAGFTPEATQMKEMIRQLKAII